MKSLSLHFHRVGLSWSAWLLTATCVSAQNVDFGRDIFPVFQKSCLDCHQEPKEVEGKLKKPKAGIRLDAARAIAMGGDDGEFVVPGDPSGSTLVQVVKLPPGHTDAMPPKNKGTPLSAVEVATLERWIQQGAKFGAWKGNERGLPPAPATPPGKTIDVWELVTGGATQQSLEKLGVLVTTLDPAKGTLRIEFSTEAVKIKDAQLKPLVDMAPKIVELDLSRTSVSDDGLAVLKGMTQLKRLNLRGTSVTDAALEHIKGLASLQSLNLVGTKVTDAALPLLKGLKNLKTVYLADTQVSSRMLEQAQKGLPTTKLLFGGWDGFDPE
jgi:Planctomycete cytochrome C/Leucine rich repeat